MRSLREWLSSYWVTYVEMSRAERREIVRRLEEIRDDPSCLVEVNRPDEFLAQHDNDEQAL